MRWGCRPTLPEQFQAVRSVLASFGERATAEQVAKAYARAPRAKVQEILETLAAQGFVRVGEGGEYLVA
jgi:DNA-binding IclR family transcriptional regulator